MGAFGLAKTMRARLALGICLVLVVALLGLWFWRAKHAVVPPTPADNSTVAVISGDAPDSSVSASSPTMIYAHNLMLRKGSTGFRVYVRWLRGQMARTSRNNNPSFDEPDSFVLDVKTGVIHTNVEDEGIRLVE